MYPFFETICIEEGKALHLEFHFERMRLTLLQHYGSAMSFAEFCSMLTPLPHQNTSVKCRLTYGNSGYCLDCTDYIPKEVNSLALIEAPELSYSYKYSNREQLDFLRQSVPQDEIIIVQSGCLCDTSFSNICLFDGKKWVTPEEPLLKGTARARLLKRGILEAVPVKVEHLGHYQKIMLINAMLDFNEERSMEVGVVL